MTNQKTNEKKEHFSYEDFSRWLEQARWAFGGNVYCTLFITQDGIVLQEATSVRNLINSQSGQSQTEEEA